MVYLQCCFYGLLVLVCSVISTPTTQQYDYYSSRQPHAYMQQQQIQNEPQYYFVDIHRFSTQFSTHLLFDHIDGSLSTLSKRISLHFQDLVQVSSPTLELNNTFVVDVDLLKGQLQGAVGSFIEDSLPAIWSARGTAIDKASLSNYVERVTKRYCQPHDRDVISSTCIEYNARPIVADVDRYIRSHLFDIIQVIVQEDLPPLFSTTQSHVNGILAHFSHTITAAKKKINTNSFVKFSFENSTELISYLQSFVDHLYHASLEETMSLKKYTFPSRVD